MKEKTVYILGAGFSKAIGICKIGKSELLPPLDADFFYVLEKEGLLEYLLADKPCLRHLLDWANIYDINNGRLKQKDFSLEKLWSQINLMLKLNSSISGFPDFGFLSNEKRTVNGIEMEYIPNIDNWKSEMSNDEESLYDIVSEDSNFFNPDGMILYFAEYEMKRMISEIYSEMDYQSEKKGAIEKFKKIVDDSPIISFNYDCLVEKIFDRHLLYNYDERLSQNMNNSLIIKPHGSLGWVVTKTYYQEEGTIEVVERIINRKEAQASTFTSKNLINGELNSKTPIIIPMSPGKESFVSSLDPGRIEICNDNELNKKREFIDCVVSYAKMLEIIRQAERVIFIGYSFPTTDYESALLFNLAFGSSMKIECHICVKGNNIPNPDISCNRVIYYKDGFEHFLDNFT
ncbi:MAG: hypothetical protein IIA61_01795 [Candidatus Marinimicrobia bacterium]|nr:hypothetical protein [Candidatus Neomarinimicrobiota bacterium]